MRLGLTLLFLSVSAGLAKASASDELCQACARLAEHVQRRLVDTGKRDEEVHVGHRIDENGKPIRSRALSYLKSESRLIDILDGACDGSPRKTECHALLEDYDSEIRDWFSAEEHAPFLEKVCFAKLKGCSAKALERQTHDASETVRGFGKGKPEETAEQGTVKAGLQMLQDMKARLFDKSAEYCRFATDRCRKLDICQMIPRGFDKIRPQVETALENAQLKCRIIDDKISKAMSPQLATYACPNGQCWPVWATITVLMLMVSTMLIFSHGARPSDRSKTRRRSAATAGSHKNLASPQKGLRRSSRLN